MSRLTLLLVPCLCWLTLAIAPVARADCPPWAGPMIAADVGLSAAQASAAFEAMSEQTFRARAATMRGQLPCVRDSIGPSLAAAIHRVEALDAFLLGDEAATWKALIAMNQSDPGLPLTPAQAPSGGALWGLWEHARATRETVGLPIAPPEGLVVVVDGRPSRMRPALRHAVIQVLDSTGDVLWSGYVSPMAALTPWPEPPPSPWDVAQRSRKRP